jgi:hypothetical protein
MKTKLTILLLVIVSQFTFGQHRKLTDKEMNNSTAIKIRYVDTLHCTQIDELFKNDIKSKTIFLFLQGGIEPIVYSTDKKFEKKYGIYFQDFGCISPNYKCIIKYNYKVFDYLTMKYGEKWKKEIREDVIGLKEWNKIK